jgi:hypothetical protein
MRQSFIWFLVIAAIALPALASHRSGFDLAIVVDDVEQPELVHRGKVYIEALRGREFAIRLTNPTSHRVAVALSVDGLNTIDARHTDPWSASKWVIEPYASTVISGWQVSGSTARRFYFTGERDSYGAKIGRTENLGVIEAVVYRQAGRSRRWSDLFGQRKEESASSESAPEARGALSDEHAATGMGSRQHHAVERVQIDLDPSPIASFRLRYEFRPQLVELGVLPRDEDPLDRRERARGFDRWCPEPD